MHEEQGSAIALSSATAAAGSRTLMISAAQHERLVRAALGDADAAAAFDAAMDADPVRLIVEVISTKSVPAGSGVSYGHTYVTASETVLARIAIGYGHGLPRKAGNRAAVTWGDSEATRLPIVGRVAMDEFVVDIGEATVSPGESVVVFGDARRGEIPLREWAGSVGESPVSVASCFDERTKRVIS